MRGSRLVVRKTRALGAVDAAILAFIRRAALSGAPAPVNEAILERLEVEGIAISFSAIGKRVRRLVAEGHLAVEWRGTHRRYRIGGKWTAFSVPGAVGPKAGRTSTDRPCLNCGHTFRSEGPHHRMCATCRQLRDPLPDCGVAL